MYYFLRQEMNDDPSIKCGIHSPTVPAVVYGECDVGGDWKNSQDRYYDVQQHLGSTTTAPLNSSKLNPFIYQHPVEHTPRNMLPYKEESVDVKRTQSSLKTSTQPVETFTFRSRTLLFGATEGASSLSSTAAPAKRVRKTIDGQMAKRLYERLAELAFLEGKPTPVPLEMKDEKQKLIIALKEIGIEPMIQWKGNQAEMTLTQEEFRKLNMLLREENVESVIQENTAKAIINSLSQFERDGSTVTYRTRKDDNNESFLRITASETPEGQQQLNIFEDVLRGLGLKCDVEGEGKVLIVKCDKSLPSEAVLQDLIQNAKDKYQFELSDADTFVKQKEPFFVKDQSNINLFNIRDNYKVIMQHLFGLMKEIPTLGYDRLEQRKKFGEVDTAIKSLQQAILSFEDALKKDVDQQRGPANIERQQYDVLGKQDKLEAMCLILRGEFMNQQQPPSPSQQPHPF